MDKQSGRPTRLDFEDSGHSGFKEISIDSIDSIDQGKGCSPGDATPQLAEVSRPLLHQVPESRSGTNVCGP